MSTIAADFPLFLAGYLVDGGSVPALETAVETSNGLSPIQQSEMLAYVPEPAGILAVVIAGATLRRPRSRDSLAPSAVD